MENSKEKIYELKRKQITLQHFSTESGKRQTLCWCLWNRELKEYLLKIQGGVKQGKLFRLHRAESCLAPQVTKSEYIIMFFLVSHKENTVEALLSEALITGKVL